MDANGVVELLRRERPSFHTDLLAPVERRAAGIFNWQIGDDVLRWLSATVRPGWRTLETGCGFSTVVFATVGCRHTTISPDSVEHETVRAWCRAHEIAFEVELVAGYSQDVLPRRAPEPLDLVLLDGDHAFPAPFLDWYYTAESVRPGGVLLVDDTQLVTGDILRSFLLREAGRWRHEGDLGKTALFRRVTEGPVVRGLWWGQQPWCAEPVRPAGARARLRTHLRRVLGRARTG